MIPECTCSHEDFLFSGTHSPIPFTVGCKWFFFSFSPRSADDGSIFPYTALFFFFHFFPWCMCAMPTWGWTPNPLYFWYRAGEKLRVIFDDGKCSPVGNLRWRVSDVFFLLSEVMQSFCCLPYTLVHCSFFFNPVFFFPFALRKAESYLIYALHGFVICTFIFLGNFRSL